MNGELERCGDRWKLRFTRELAHPAEKVWRAVTEPAHLDAWFPADHRRVAGRRAAEVRSPGRRVSRIRWRGPRLRAAIAAGVPVGHRRDPLRDRAERRTRNRMHA